MAVLDFHIELFIVTNGQITTDAADEVVMLERFWLAHGRCLPRQAMPWLLAISRTKIVFQICCSFRIRRVPRGRKTAYLSLYRADLSTSIAARGAGYHHGNESMVHNRNIEGLRSRLGRDGAGAGRSGHRNGARRQNTGPAGRTLRRASGSAHARCYG